MPIDFHDVVYCKAPPCGYCRDEYIADYRQSLDAPRFIPAGSTMRVRDHDTKPDLYPPFSATTFIIRDF